MKLLTRKEVAQILKIGLRTLDRRIEAGDLECHRLGDGPQAPVRISEEQLADYLAKCRGKQSLEIRQKAEAILKDS